MNDNVVNWPEFLEDSEFCNWLLTAPHLSEIFVISCDLCCVIVNGQICQNWKQYISDIYFAWNILISTLFFMRNLAQ